MPPSLQHKFSLAEARLAGLKSGESRRVQRKRLRELETALSLALAPKPAVELPKQLFHLLPDTLANALQGTLERLLSTDDPKDKALLARAARDLRETWHLCTGQPLPGRTKPTAERRGRTIELPPEPIDLPSSSTPSLQPAQLTQPSPSTQPANGYRQPGQRE